MLAKQKLLETLFEKAFPDFMVGATDYCWGESPPAAAHACPTPHQLLPSCTAEDNWEQQVQHQQDGAPQQPQQQSPWQADRLEDIVEVLDDSGDSSDNLSDVCEEQDTCGVTPGHPGGSAGSAQSTNHTPTAEHAAHKMKGPQGTHWQQTSSIKQPTDPNSFNSPRGSSTSPTPLNSHVLPAFPAKKALHCSHVWKDGSLGLSGNTLSKENSRPSSAAPIMLGSALTTKAAVQGRPATACARRGGITDSPDSTHSVFRSRPATSCSSARFATRPRSHCSTSKAGNYPVAVQLKILNGQQACQAALTEPALSFDAHSITRSFLEG
jgi:hypothetical protein